ncbi:hypothetical protein CHS0354_011769 [Potamilus streckersoni]|uniref:Uncharacterized protein n=1 Tax=Potamilus streckersoni TaxID=2493646 RepID=A0AAE0TGI6_9BIVA|nr:hypothetical protein CHS0354_011769 [Potamilus streckersoni]
MPSGMENKPLGGKITKYFSTELKMTAPGRLLMAHRKPGKRGLGQQKFWSDLWATGAKPEMIEGLQNGRRGIFYILPQNDKPQLSKQLGQKTVELHVSGLPHKNSKYRATREYVKEIQYKTHKSPNGNILGISKNSDRNKITFTKADATKIPASFFVMGFINKTWYNGCQYHRRCFKCGNTDPLQRDCHTQSTSPKSYAVVSASKINQEVVAAVPDTL